MAKCIKCKTCKIKGNSSCSAPKLQIVQFTHPGAEHSVTFAERKAGIKNWNMGGHRRKFMKAEGQIVMPSGLSYSKDILFWGEWEPTSKIYKLQSLSGVYRTPKWLHEPFLQMKNGKIVLPTSTVMSGGCVSSCAPKGSCTTAPYQNTDPMVFGDNFYYSLCKQLRFTGLKALAPGSIILFGSTILKGAGAPYFQLDTVFVVGEGRCYTPKTAVSDLAGFVPRDYIDLMGFKQWKGAKANQQYVCYKGANYANPTNGMFSFVPCKPCGKTQVGFPRLKLTSSNLPFIKDSLNTPPKYNPFGMSQVVNYWNAICQIVKNQGYEIGVNLSYQIIP